MLPMEAFSHLSDVNFNLCVLMIQIARSFLSLSCNPKPSIIYWNFLFMYLMGLTEMNTYVQNR